MGETLTILNVFPNDTIKSVKEQINDKTGAHIELQELTYDNCILKYDHQSLYHLHIAHESILYLKILHFRITVTIKMKGDRTIILHQLTSTCVNEVKQQIYLRENIPIKL